MVKGRNSKNVSKGSKKVQDIKGDKSKAGKWKTPEKSTGKHLTRSKGSIAMVNKLPAKAKSVNIGAKINVNSVKNKSPKPLDGCFRRVLMKEAPQLFKNPQVVDREESSEGDDLNNNVTIVNPVVGSAKSLINSIKNRKHKLAIEAAKPQDKDPRDRFYNETPRLQCSQARAYFRHPFEEPEIKFFFHFSAETTCNKS